MKPPSPLTSLQHTLKPLTKGDKEAPKELEHYWPYQQGSVLRYVFQQIWYAKNEGLSRADFDAMFKPGGLLAACADPGRRLQALKSGRAGRTTQTHSFELTEIDGRLRIANPKFIRHRQRELPE